MDWRDRLSREEEGDDVTDIGGLKVWVPFDSIDKLRGSVLDLPSSAGQVGTLQPPSASVRCQARAVAANWGVSTSRRWRVARPYGAACSSMKARTSARRAASAGVSSAPFGRSLRLLTVRPRSWWVRG